MNETKRDAIRKALERTGSLEALLEGIVRSESEEFRKYQQEVERGADHPSSELLRAYAFGRVSREEDQELTKHISLCSVCADVVFRLQYSGKDAKDTVIAWTARLRNLVSGLSFPVSIHALEAVRGATEDQERCYKPGTALVISIEAPADGYVAVFHGCEETGEGKLVFPWQAKDNPRVSEGQRVEPIRGDVEGPPGKHFLKVFWTRERPPDPRKFDLHNDEQREQAEREFFDVLCNLNEEDWRTATRYYEVIEG